MIETEVKSITKDIIESSRIALKARFAILKNMPSSIANQQIITDTDIDVHMRELLEFNFHTGFATLGALTFDDDFGFKVVDADIDNKKFKFEYKGKLYASLRLLHMLTNTNKEIQDKEEEIMQMIEDYYIVSRNIPFYFDNNGNVSRDESLATNVIRWTSSAEFECRKMSDSEEEILAILDKYADEAIKALVESIEKTAQQEMEYLLGE